jgi:hypothetical protein
VDEKERLTSSPIGVVEPRVVDDAIRHGTTRLSETAEGSFAVKRLLATSGGAGGSTVNAVPHGHHISA